MELPQRRKNRLEGYDYSRAGYYFVTICAKDRAELFWDPSARIVFGHAPTVGAACGRPPLSEVGVCVQAEINHLSRIYDGITVDKYVIMPNHIHLILRIDSMDGGRPQAAPTVSRIVNQFKGAVTKKAGGAVWQKSFHDHVIRNGADYLRIWEYIDTNPAKWREDCYYTEYTEETP